MCHHFAKQHLLPDALNRLMKGGPEFSINTSATSSSSCSGKLGTKQPNLVIQTPGIHEKIERSRN